MLISLGLALLGQSSIATARVGSGLKVYPNTGPLENFKGVRWRYNGEMQPWGSHSDIDFVPMVKNAAAVAALEVDPFMWDASPEITGVCSLEFPYTSGNNISVADAVALHKRISAQLHSSKGGALLLGAPSFHGQHNHTDGYAYTWVQASHLCFVQKEWVKACNGECHYDFIAFDFEGDNMEDLIDLMGGLHTIYQRPIWIKGLSCITLENLPCTADKAQSFMMDSIAYFRSTDFVDRWVWDGADPKIDEFGDPSGMLMIEDGVLSLTPTGHLYLKA